MFNDDTTAGERVALGGPADGGALFWRPARGQAGLILVDKAAGRSWIYGWDAESSALVCRNPEGAELDTSADDWAELLRQGGYDIAAKP